MVPLRKRIWDKNLLRYNGMLTSVFDLLVEARDQIASITGAVETSRDHWVAETNLQSAITGRSPGLLPDGDQPRTAAAAAASH